MAILNPTLKQEKAVKIMVENGGNVSSAMRAAGYSPATAQNPKKLTESKTFKELVKRAAPQSLVKKVLKEGLQATHDVAQIIDRDSKGAPVYEYIEKPDFNARHKYLKTALELHDALTPQLTPQAGNTYNFFYSPQIRALGTEYEQKLTEALTQATHVQEAQTNQGSNAPSENAG